MAKVRRNFIQVLQEKFTPLEHEIDWVTETLADSYHARMQQIKDGWYRNEESFLYSDGRLGFSNASKEYLSHERWLSPSKSIEHHATRSTLNDAVLLDKPKKISDLLDFLIEIDDMEPTVMQEAMKYGLKRDLRKNLDMRALAKLTTNEADIYSQWMGGKTQSFIAKEKGVSRQTINETFKRITLKLSGESNG